MQKLVDIQKKLKAPKNQFNKFGGYNYRSCEDILEAVKPLLVDVGMLLTIQDDIIEIGGRVYVKATATVTDVETANGHHVSVSAFAREAETKKGMDEAQITGSASSYARKYALNGLFLIDDTKDPDSTNKHGKEENEDTRMAKGKKAIEDMIYSKAVDTNLMPQALKDLAKIRNVETLTGVYKALKGFVADEYATQQWNDLMAQIGVA